MTSEGNAEVEQTPEQRRGDIRQTLELFASDDGIIEVRALKCWERNPSYKVTVAGYYTRDRLDDAVNHVIGMQRYWHAAGVYVTLNPVMPDLLARAANRTAVADRGATTKDAEIVRRCWILIDFDPKRPAGVSSTDAELATAEAQARECAEWLIGNGWPQPVIAMSGNGYHLLFRVDLPTRSKLVEACLRALAVKFPLVDSSNHNPSRITKCYGTIARKGDSTPDRPHRYSRLVEVPNDIHTVPLDRVEWLAAQLPKPTVKAKAQSTGSEAVDIPRYLDNRRVPIIKQDVWNGSQRFFIECPGIASHSTSNSDADCSIWQDPSGQISAKCFHASCGIGSWADISNVLGKVTRYDFANATPITSHGAGDLSGGASLTMAGDPDEEPEQPPEPDWTSVLTPEGLTERANARRLLAQYSDAMRHCFAWKKWLVWDGARWVVDDAAAMRLAMTISDQLWMRIKPNLNPDNLKFAIDTAKASGIAHMLKLAAPDVEVKVSELDANPFLLNCPNGTVDLRTGELRPHRREDSITKLCPTNYNPEAGSYHFDRFLESTFGNQHLIDFIQRLFGYCLTGDVTEQILPVFHGKGSNGKSTILKAVQLVLGSDFSSAAPEALLIEKKGESHPTELAGLFGKRLVVSSETGDGSRLAEALVKKLTGGDVIAARRMREDFWEFVPTHKLVLCTNHKPTVRGTDHAIWRRLVLVPFSQQFWNPEKGESGPPELMRDNTLDAKLAAEAEGILAWMVRGCLEWQRGGLRIPDIVRAATEEYQSESDVIGRFISSQCHVGQAFQVKFSALYTAFEQWCNDGGERVPTKTAVGRYLTDHQFRDKQSGCKWYLGIALRDFEHTVSAAGLNDVSV